VGNYGKPGLFNGDLSVGRAARVATEILIALYKEHRTLDRVAAACGLNRATIHERLQRAGFELMTPAYFTDDERAKIKDYYTLTPAEIFSLDELSTSLDRQKTSISREARKMGLTNPARPFSAGAKASMKEASAGRWGRHPHPRGMAGKTQSQKNKDAVSAASKLKWATDKAFGIGQMSEENRQKRSDRSLALANATPSSNCYSRCKHGKREDLGDIHFRSAWEANYARYLNLLIKMKIIDEWNYEPITFWFEAIKRGVRSYKPDFSIRYRGETQIVYVEVKGWFDDKSKTKMKRMKKYHPTVKIEFVGAKEYKATERKWSSAIPNWEGSK
jgi:hypothetical protein